MPSKNPRLLILEDISIGEVSKVGRAAHQRADGVIMKRNSPEAPNDSEASTFSSANKGVTYMADKQQDEELKILKAKVEEVSGALDKLNALTGDELTHYAKQDAEGRKAFLDLSPIEREADIRKAAEQSDVVYRSVDGTEYTKSDEASLIAMAKKSDELRLKVEALEKSAEQAELIKQASTLSHLPGTTEEVATILGSLKALGDGQAYKRSFEILCSHNDSLANGFKEASEVQGRVKTQGTPAEKLDQMAVAYAQENKCAKSVAYDAILDQHTGDHEARRLYHQIQ